MTFIIILAAVLAIAFLMAASFDHRRHHLRDTKDPRAIRSSARAHKSDDRERGARWSAGR